MPFLLDARQLLAFTTTADCGSFTAAAQELNLTQSAISHSLKALEQQLDCQLLQRDGRKVTLTHQGRLLLPRALSVLKEFDHIHTELCEDRSNPMGMLTLAATPGASQYLLPSIFKAFRKIYPRYELRVLPGDSGPTAARVLAGEADLGLCLEPEPEAAQSLEAHPLFHDEITWYASPEHPLAKGETTPQAVSRHTLLVSNRAGQTFRQISDYLLAHAIHPRSILEMGSLEACKEMTQAGLGIMPCARWLVEDEVAEGKLCQLALGDSKLIRTWVVCYRRNRPLHAAEMEFVRLCQVAGKARSWRKS